MSLACSSTAGSWRSLRTFHEPEPVVKPTRVAEVRYLSYETTLHARGPLWVPGLDQVDLLDALRSGASIPWATGSACRTRYPMDLGVLLLVYCR